MHNNSNWSSVCVEASKILLPSAWHLKERQESARQADSQPISQSGRQAVSQAVSQASRQAGRQVGRNTQFGFSLVAA
jgi:predicted secreted protein